MLREDRIGAIEDSTGEHTVARLVDSSLGMLKDETTLLTFMALGVCPEDILMKLPVVELICSSSKGFEGRSKPTKMAIRRSLKNLLGGCTFHILITHCFTSVHQQTAISCKAQS